MAGQFSAAFLVAASAVLLFFGLTQAYGEISPYFTAGSAGGRRFAAIISGEYAPGASLASKERYFSDCLDIAESIYARAQPTVRRTALLETCAAATRAAIASMPSYARAWLTLATVNAELGRNRRFLSALAKTRAVAPDVAWLADRRMMLALRHETMLDAGGQAGLDRDIAVLFESRVGAAALAARYAARPDLRERLVAIAEQAPPAGQRRFLAAVKQAMAGASP